VENVGTGLPGLLGMGRINVGLTEGPHPTSGTDIYPRRQTAEAGQVGKKWPIVVSGKQDELKPAFSNATPEGTDIEGCGKT